MEAAFPTTCSILPPPFASEIFRKGGDTVSPGSIRMAVEHMGMHRSAPSDLGRSSPLSLQILGLTGVLKVPCQAVSPASLSSPPPEGISSPAQAPE